MVWCSLRRGRLHSGGLQLCPNCSSRRSLVARRAEAEYLGREVRPLCREEELISRETSLIDRNESLIGREEEHIGS